MKAEIIAYENKNTRKGGMKYMTALENSEKGRSIKTEIAPYC